MTFEILVTTGILLAVVYCCVRDVVPVHLAAMVGFAVAVATGVLSQREMLSVFSSSAPFTIACMFVLSAAIERSGMLNVMVDKLTVHGKDAPMRTVCALFAAVAVLAFFMNNTPIVLLFAPIFVKLGQQIRIPSSKLLIPLSYISMMAGMCTLIGTSTNLLADGVSQQQGLAPFTMFELFPAGFATLVAGCLYLFFVGRYLLPVRRPLRDVIREERAPVPESFVTDIIITDDSPFIGKTLHEIDAGKATGAEIIDLIRNDLDKPLPVKHLIAQTMPWNRKGGDEGREKSAVYDVPLKAGYRITLRATRSQIEDLREFFHAPLNEDDLRMEEVVTEEPKQLTDILITNTSHYIGMRVSDILTFKFFGLDVVALHRKGHQERDIASNLLQRGDVLVLEGTKESIERFKKRERRSSSEGEGADGKLPMWRKYGPLVVLALIVILSTLQVMPIASAALVGAVAIILLRFVSLRDAYESIQWPILMLIYGMLGIGLAFEKSGAANGVVAFVIDIVQDTNPIIVLSCVYLLTSILTEAMTNNAVALIMTPLAIGVATSLGLDPRAFVVAVMLAASSSFATPMSYQTNAYVYTLGNYKFMDFVKVGMPLNIIGWAVATFVIPVFWPL